MPTASNALGEAAGAAARLPCLHGDGLGPALLPAARHDVPGEAEVLPQLLTYHPFQRQRKPLMPDRQHDSLLDQ